MADEANITGTLAGQEEAAKPSDAARTNAVKKIFHDLIRTVSVMRLYNIRNDVVVRSLTELVDSFTACLTHSGTLRIGVGSLEFRLGKEIIHKDSKREDSIPYRLYRDGIRELVFMVGLSAEEIEDFVDILRKEEGEGGLGSEDLVSLLWKKDFSNIDYMAIDDLSDQAGEEGDSEVSDEPKKKDERRDDSPYRLQLQDINLDEILPKLEQFDHSSQELSGSYKMALGFIDLDNPIFKAEKDKAPGEAGGPQVTSKSDAELFLDLKSVPVRELGEESRSESITSLYQLTAQERDKIREEIAGDTISRLCSTACNLVFGILGSSTGALPEESLVNMLIQMIQGMIKGADFKSVNSALDRLVQISEGGFGAGAAVKDKLYTFMASPENVLAAASSFTPKTISDGKEFLSYLGKLPVSSLDILVKEYGEIQKKDAGIFVKSIIVSSLKSNPLILSSVIASGHEDLIEEIINLLTIDKELEAPQILTRTINHPGKNIRLLTLKALLETRLPQGSELAASRIDDKELDVRMLAMKIMSSNSTPRALEILKGRIHGPGFDALSLQERTAFFQTLASAGRDAAVTFFEEILQKRSWFSKGKTAELKRLAALALGSIGTTEAIAVLERGVSSRDKSIKATCERALAHARNIKGNN